MKTQRTTAWQWMTLGTTGLLIFGASRLALQGQEANRDDSQLERQANSFFDGLLAGPSSDACDRLLAGTQFAARPEVVRDLKTKTDELEKRFGRYRGYEWLETRRLGQDVALLRYVLKCENYPVLWHFTFYRTATPPEATPLGDDQWKLISLKFNTQFEQFAR